jgi:hypothetical protein
MVEAGTPPMSRKADSDETGQLALSRVEDRDVARLQQLEISGSASLGTDESSHEPSDGWLATSAAELTELMSEQSVVTVSVRSNAGTGEGTSRSELCR